MSVYRAVYREFFASDGAIVSDMYINAAMAHRLERVVIHLITPLSNMFNNRPRKPDGKRGGGQDAADQVKHCGTP